ncbi:MAG: cell division protein FtsA [Prevotellaceae bacterium]|jgi:cell division protein FtsA|nr:cell division protein FtsA [Prevotellaceae bacterium]
MEKNDYIMSIDIGTTKIVAMIGRVNAHGRIEVVAQHRVDSQGVWRGIVENIDDASYSIKDCLDGLYKQTDVRQRNVIVGIAGSHISSTQNNTSILRANSSATITEGEVLKMQRDMYKIALKPGQEILQILAQDYVIDGEPVAKAVGRRGSKLTGNYHIVLGETASISNIRACVERCGLALKKLVLEPLASADATLTKEEREAGVALLDIGGGTSDLAVLYQNTVRGTYVIPCGGELITNDIRHICNIPRRKAELVKCRFGSCLSDCASADQKIVFGKAGDSEARLVTGKTLAGIIQDRMEQIIDSVRYRINESGYGDRIQSIVLTGGSSQMRHLPQLVKLRTGLDARIGYPTVLVAAEGKPRDLDPTKSTSVGLMMSGYEEMVAAAGQPALLQHLPGWLIGKRLVKNIVGRFDRVFEEDEHVIPS